MGWRDEAIERLSRGERVDRITALLGIERRTLVGLGHANGFRFDSNGYAHRARQAGDSTDARDLIRPHLEHPDRKVARAASCVLPLLDRLYADLGNWQAKQQSPRTRHQAARAWARDRGIEVPLRGPVPAKVLHAYLQAQGVST